MLRMQVVKKARGFEVRKVQRRLARAQDGTSALAAAKKIKSRPGVHWEHIYALFV